MHCLRVCGEGDSATYHSDRLELYHRHAGDSVGPEVGPVDPVNP